MLFKNTMGLVLAGTIVLAGSAVLIHQGAATPQEPQQKTLKKVPIVPSKPESGQQMYKDYCAACHGPTGKGDGPAVEFLKAPPSDLTTMAKRNNGKFPKSISSLFCVSGRASILTARATCRFGDRFSGRKIKM